MKYKIEMIIDSLVELSNEDIKSKFSKVQSLKMEEIGKNIYIRPNITDYIAVSIPKNSLYIEWSIADSDSYPHQTRMYLDLDNMTTECAADIEDFESYGLDIENLEIDSIVDEFDSIRLNDKKFVLLKIEE